MIRIMFVCHGNICRSPMAEFIMKEIVRQEGAEADFAISSAATSCEEIGNPIYPPAAAEMRRRGIPFDEKKCAVRVKKSDYGSCDLFVVMDSANLRNILRIFGGDPEGKVHRLLEFADRSGDVADPWYSRRFDTAFEDIREGCMGLWRKLSE